MFEQDRYTENRRARSPFLGKDGPAPGMSRFQVSGENDPAEIQAEAMADSVMGGGGLFRSPEGSGGSGFQADLDTADLEDAGESLPEGLQSSMEQSFGAGFSGVRVHTGAGADRASRSISARAFTRGQDVYFRSGAYDPGSREGQHLIAHELAHVAAGDGGIHRDPDEEPGSLNVGDLAIDMLGVEMDSQRPLQKAQELTEKWGNKDSLLNQLAADTIEEKELEPHIREADQTEKELDELISYLKKDMKDYMTLLAGTDEDSQKQIRNSDPSYQDASELLIKLEAAKKNVGETVKLALTGAMREAGGDKNARDEDLGFTETVVNMMDDPTCGQFFTAVEDVRKGAGGAGDFGALNKDAVDHAANLHEDVKETRAERTSRVAGTVSTGAGIASAATDLVGGGLDVSSAVKEAGGGEANQHEEKSSVAFSSLGAISGGVGMTADAVGAGADAVALHKQESARKDKIREMQEANGKTDIGKASAARHRDRTAIAGSVMGVIGSGAGVVSSSGGAAGKERLGSTAGITSSAFGAAGDVLGLAVDSDNAREKKQRDVEAKNSMRALGKQLEDTLPESDSLTDSELKIKEICRRLKGEKFNKSNSGLVVLISSLLNNSGTQVNAGAGTAPATSPATSPTNSAGTAPATSPTNSAGTAPATSPTNSTGSGGGLNEKQERLLKTLLALEESRMNNKASMSDARRDAIFSAVGLTGDLFSLAGGVATRLGNKVLGSILSVVGSFIGALGTIRDAMGLGETETDRQNSRNGERDTKVAACRSAVGQMATLPELDWKTLKGKREKKLPLEADQQKAAEEYASVFNIVKTADVNMVDFLYAIHKGEFGKKDEHGGNKKSAEDSLKDMYANLSFSYAD